MIVKAEEDIELFRKAGKLAGFVLEEICKKVAPGISTGEIDAYAEKLITDAGAIPTFKGYRGFPATVCASVNEEVVHGIPNKHKVLKEGDVISLDLGVTFRRTVNGKKQDFIGDTAVTVPVGQVAPRVAKLLEDTRASLYAGIRASIAGASLDDIAGPIEDIAKSNSYGIVREYGGHGIGYNYHEEPFILNYRTGSKERLKPGMVIAIEPMFNLGGDRVKVKPDKWTVVTQDYKPSAHFEHSLLIIENGEPEILTRRPSEEI
ncbi:MAG: type I methionyl aminopeptidase [Candidatus Obscuribacterales bacterium]|nr:type I methionyl aminopeptidase [Candidatus Obscuribacterales bacterium]